MMEMEMGTWPGMELEAQRVEERKLVRGYPFTGYGLAILRADMRAFEKERGCAVGELLVGRWGFMRLVRLVGMSEMTKVRVRMDEGVREGHVILVGEMDAAGDEAG